MLKRQQWRKRKADAEGMFIGCFSHHLPCIIPCYCAITDSLDLISWCRGCWKFNIEVFVWNGITCFVGNVQILPVNLKAAQMMIPLVHQVSVNPCETWLKFSLQLGVLLWIHVSIMVLGRVP